MGIPFIFPLIIIMICYCVSCMKTIQVNEKARLRAKQEGKRWYYDCNGSRRDVDHLGQFWYQKGRYFINSVTGETIDMYEQQRQEYNAEQEKQYRKNGYTWALYRTKNGKMVCRDLNTNILFKWLPAYWFAIDKYQNDGRFFVDEEGNKIGYFRRNKNGDWERKY